MRKIIGTIGATLALVAALATTATAQVDFSPSRDKIRVTSVATGANLSPGMPQVVGSAHTNVDREGPGDEIQDPDGGGLSADWEDNWFEDYEAGDELDETDGQILGAGYATVTSIMGGFVPWAQPSDRFV